MKTGSVFRTPSAVEFSSSSSPPSSSALLDDVSSDADADDAGAAGLISSAVFCSRASFELVMIRSDSLSLSSYSS